MPKDYKELAQLPSVDHIRFLEGGACEITLKPEWENNGQYELSSLCFKAARDFVINAKMVA